MTDANNIRKYLDLVEGPGRAAQDYVGPKDSDTVSYEAHGTGDEINKIVANLKSYDSGRYTKLGRNLLRIEALTKEINELKEDTKQETRELVADLFHAEDVVSTRVVETVSFTFQLSKDPKATETYKYAKILEELEEHMTPELLTMLEALKAKHKSVVQKAPSLKAVDKAATESIVTEGPMDKLKSFFSGLYQKVKSWGAKYDNKLDSLKAQAGLTESVGDEYKVDSEAFDLGRKARYNFANSKRVEGKHFAKNPFSDPKEAADWKAGWDHASEYGWDKEDILGWTANESIDEALDPFYQEIAKRMRIHLDDDLIDAIQFACVTQQEWEQDPSGCVSRIMGALEEIHSGDHLGESEECDHEWVEGVDDDGELVEPAYDVCINCGETRH